MRKARLLILSLHTGKMCGRVTQFTAAQNFYHSLGLSFILGQPRYNISPGTKLVSVRREYGELKAEQIYWGFIPAWARGSSTQEEHANARIETVSEKITFKDAVKHHRCLIAVDGYYEWKTVGKLKVPYYFKRTDGEPLILAGLWSTQMRRDGETQKSLCLLTTKPNREAAQVHSRMPVIISHDNQKLWLSDQPLSQSTLDFISATPAAGLLNLYRVSSEVNRVVADKPELINPVVGQLDQPDFLGDLLGEA
ncbi:MAG: SOS response-associated peptidase [Opitutae bacterium]